jgi:hypothetical protein
MENDWLDSELENEFSLCVLYQGNLKDYLGFNFKLSYNNPDSFKKFIDEEVTFVKIWLRPENGLPVIVFKFSKPGIAANHLSGSLNSWGFSEDTCEYVSLKLI